MKRWIWIVALAACGDGADRKAPIVPPPPPTPVVVAVAAPERPVLPEPEPAQVGPAIFPSVGEKVVLEDDNASEGAIVDVVDKCPDVPTNDDADDGCPEPAPPPVVIDSDDVPDVLDRCPDEAPDPDDTDGCPDPA